MAGVDHTLVWLGLSWLETSVFGRFPKFGDPDENLQNTTIPIMGTPKELAIILGIPHFVFYQKAVKSEAEIIVAFVIKRCGCRVRLPLTLANT